MRIDISAKGIEITGAIRDYAKKKISALSRFLKGARELRASLMLGKETAHHREGEVFVVEAELSVDGRSFHSDEKGDDLYATIDAVQEELERMITKRKGKTGEHAAPRRQKSEGDIQEILPRIIDRSP